MLWFTAAVCHSAGEGCHRTMDPTQLRQPNRNRNAWGAHDPPLGIGAIPRVVRARQLLVVPLVVSAMAVGCGDTRPAWQPEGTVAFEGGSGLLGASQTHVTPGLPFHRPGMLIPARQQTWKSAWVEPEKNEHPLLRGATAGMTTGIGFLMMTPMAMTFWPAAVGIMVGSTTAGILGSGLAEGTDVRMSPPDQKVILAATEGLQPERLFRESLERALNRRTGEPLVHVAWDAGQGPDTTATDPLVAVRDRQLDGVIECGVTALGLAAGEERDTFGVFAQVRVRALDARDGRVRYDRVLGYGPGQNVAGLPRVDFHTMELLAADRGRVFRQVASDAIQRMARILAEDPQLPIAR